MNYLPTLLLLLCLTWTSSGTSYHSLKTGMRLANNDQIVSTLGSYKMMLNSNDCSLQFWRWDLQTQIYQRSQIRYRNNQVSSCQYLTINGNRVETDVGAVFITLTSNNTAQAYLMVDDTGTMRFIGIQNAAVGLPLTDFEEFKFSNNSQNNQNIIILDSFQTLSQKVPNPITNANNWIFFFSSTELTISRNSLFYNYRISQMLFSQSGIFDYQNQTFPYVVFNRMIYSNTCNGQKRTLKGPFVLEISQYWPVATIYDQQGYKVFQYSSSNSVSYNPCPQGLFMIDRQCVTNCPTPFYHHISENKGKCVLNCQANSQYNNQTRTCECLNNQRKQHLYSCVNSTSYPLGCYCTNNTFLNTSTQRCINNCSSGSVGVSGLCVQCGLGCISCSASSVDTKAIVCTQCQSDFILSNGECSQSCPTNCRTCNGTTCLACNPLYALLNNFCVPQCPSGTQVSPQSNFSTLCVANNNTISSCPTSCLRCSNLSVCLVCKPGYTLLVSPPSVSCIRQTLLFSCSSPMYTQLNAVCYNTQTSAITTINKCLSNIANCLICPYQSTSTCLLCRQGYFLQQNSCVSSCSQGYYQINQACIKHLDQCKKVAFIQGYIRSNLNINSVDQNSIYLSYHSSAPLSEPYGYQLFTRKYFSFSNNVSDTSALSYWSQPICNQCNNGFGLSTDHQSCSPCPEGCLLCLYAYDGSCIASTQQQLSLYSLGQDLSGCKGFITVNQSCQSSCPVDTIPIFNSSLKRLSCHPTTSLNAEVTQTTYVKIQGCTFQQQDSRYIHKFVFSEPLLHRNLTTARLIQSISIRFLQSTPNSASISSDGSAIVIESSQPSAVLNLSGVVQDYESINGNFPAAIVYGVSSQTSFRAYLDQDYAWIGYIFSIALLATHCIYVGNNYMYKMDNIIIFCQSIFYFLFIRILSSNPVAQYYYGWNWLHLLFYPNYFLSALEGTASSAAPYVMYNLDANFIRNAGSSLSFLLTFFILWLLISLACYIVDSKLGRRQIWFYSISRNSIFAASQLISYNIFYWAVAYSFYDEDGNSNDTFAGITALCIIGIIVYTIIRTYFDRIACLYMIKRIVYASILASSYQKLFYVAILGIFQVIFLVFRYFYEKPSSKGEKVYLFVEQIIIILGLVLLYLAHDVIVIALIISLLVYLWYLTITVDLVDIFLRTKNKYMGANWMPCFSSQSQVIQQESSKQQREYSPRPDTNRPLSSQSDK